MKGTFFSIIWAIACLSLSLPPASFEGEVGVCLQWICLTSVQISRKAFNLVLKCFYAKQANRKG